MRNNGGYNRFRQIKAPRDYITYQTWLDFCFNCCRSDMHMPFDKRQIEIEMLDEMDLFSIDINDVNRLNEAVEKCWPNAHR